MNTIKLCYLAACLALTAASAQNTQDQAGPHKPPGHREVNLVMNGLARLGIDGSYEIVVPDTPDLVENTAVEMLQKFLGKGGLNPRVVPESKTAGKKRILLGRESNLKAIRTLGDKGKISIRDVSAEDDGFHLKRIGRDIVIAGANPRGVLYGVCALEDFVKAGRGAKLDIKKVPQIASRIEMTPTFLVSDHPAPYSDFTEESAAYFARLGVNGCIDGGGGIWELSYFVSSDVFPFQKAPDPEFRRKIQTTSSLCKKYGIDYYVMIWEPSLDQKEAAKYPPETLGAVEGTWRGSLKTLCISSPIVQEHYKNMVRKFVREYPDVKGFLFYNLDGSAWLCQPGLCPRCKLVCTDSPPETKHPWETQVLIADLLARVAREERSDFKFTHWISHFSGKEAEKLVRTSQYYTALAFGVERGDHDVMIADTVTPGGSEFLMLQQVCAEKSRPFFVTYTSNNHEVTPNGWTFPFHVSRAIKKLHGWGVRGISGCGPIPYFNQINALVEKEFQWNPDQSPETFLADLSVRQFGETAGKLMYQAWEETRNGMDVWKDIAAHPFRGSQTPTSLGFSYFTLAKAILPETVGTDDQMDVALGNVESSTDAEIKRLKLNQEKFQSMGVHLAQAAALARQAMERADPDQPIGICYYEGRPVPTMREYTELNYGPIAIADTYGRLRYNMFSATLLLKEMKGAGAAGNAKVTAEKKARYHDLLREDIAVRKRFVGLLTEFSNKRPCLTRTSLSEEGIARQIAYMNTEIAKTENYLGQHGG